MATGVDDSAGTPPEVKVPDAVAHALAAAGVTARPIGYRFYEQAGYHRVVTADGRRLLVDSAGNIIPRAAPTAIPPGEKQARAGGRGYVGPARTERERERDADNPNADLRVGGAA